jgi:hypothetical protein
MTSPIEPQLEKARLEPAGCASAQEASALIYGSIGLALFSVGMWEAGLLHDLPSLPHLSLVVAGALIAFPAGVRLRNTRKGRYVDACQAELVRIGGGFRA